MKFLKAGELDPENSEIKYNLAIANSIKDLHSKSFTHFKTAIELRQDFSEAYDDLGNTYLILCKFDLAITCFEKSDRNRLYATPLLSIISWIMITVKR